jgi:hypothetical protein
MSLMSSLEGFSKPRIPWNRRRNESAWRALEGAFPAIISAFGQSRVQESALPAEAAHAPVETARQSPPADG